MSTLAAAPAGRGGSTDRSTSLMVTAAQRRPRTAQGDPTKGRKAALQGSRRVGRNTGRPPVGDAPGRAKRWGFAPADSPPSLALPLTSDADADSEAWQDDAREEALDQAAELSDSDMAELLGQDTAPADALDGSDPAIEAELERLLGLFAWPLDPFQVTSVRHLLSGRSVVVSAPTGSGKTAIAEAATHYVLSQGQSVIYTTPLKALSNQKLGEMRERFGTDAVGLQTGDASINLDADVVIMTTEILRNTLYRTEERPEDGQEPGQRQQQQGGREEAAGNAAVVSATAGQGLATTFSARKKRSGQDRLAKVGLVVLDETHYLGDPGRGSVWEEVIINLPPHILILAMSATVRNPQDLGGWISSVHGECDVVTTAFRPVPLQWHYCLGPGDGAARLLPLLAPTGRALNQELLPPRRRVEGKAAAFEGDDWGRWDDLAGEGSKAGGGVKSAMRVRTLAELVGSSSEDEEDEEAWHRMPRWKKVPPMEAVAAELAAQAMLPAIWFIFSRKECDASATRLHALGVQLTTESERDIIAAEVAALRSDQPEAIKEAALPALLSGVAAHHAGCLPAWKALVERLFQRGIIKLVFATETLAAGINMPARTTLLSALSRRRDGQIAPLTHNELLQMAGRAGRRGYDTLGHCVIVQSRWEDPEAAWDIIRRGPEPLRSQFTTSYGMALNLLWSRSMGEAREFLERSFSRYLGGAGSRGVVQQIDRLEAKAKGIMEEAARRAAATSSQFDPGGGEGSEVSAGEEADVWGRYQKTQGRRREEKRAARILRAQLAEERAVVADAGLAARGLPRTVGLDLSGTNIDDSGYRLPALALARLDTRQELPLGATAELVAGITGGVYMCLASDNMLYLVSSRSIASLDEGHGEIAASALGADAAEALKHASELPATAWTALAGDVRCAAGSALTATAVLRMPPPHTLTPVLPSPSGLEALEAQRQRVADVKAELAGIRADKRFARASRRYAQAAVKAGALLDRASVLREELEGRLDGSWREFADVVRVLDGAGAFESAPTSPQQGSVRSAAGGPPTGGAYNSSYYGEQDAAQAGLRRRFTPLGLVAREVRGANELWLAVVLTHAAVQTLQPAQLAAAVSALVAPEAFNRANVYVAYDPSPGVTAAVEALEEARAELVTLQIAARLDVPLAVDLRLAGVVEAWASGASWSEVTADCGLDDGDVARLLMRTVDTLRQAAFCEHLLPALRSAARTAARVMDRKPISDLVT